MMLASCDNCVSIWEEDQVEPSYKIELPVRQLLAATFLNDSRRLVVGGRGAQIYIVDIYNRRKRECLLGGHDCKCLAVNREETLIAVGSSDGTFHLISLPDFLVISTFQKYNFAINAITFMKDDATVIAGDSIGHLIKFGVHIEPVLYSKFTTRRGSVSSLQTLLTGDLAVIQGKSLYIYDMYTEDIITLYDIGATAILVTSPSNDTQIIVGTSFGDVLIYDASAKSVIRTTEVTDTITAMTITPDGATVVCAYLGGLDMFNISDPQNVTHYPITEHRFATALAYQKQIIAIPEDAVFDTDGTRPSQVYFSKSRISMRSLSMRYVDNLMEEEDGDYQINKITFRKSLSTIQDKHMNGSPGRHMLARSGLAPSPIKRRNINDGQKEITGNLSFSKTGSPVYQKKKVSKLSQISAPSAQDYPSGGKKKDKNKEKEGNENKQSENATTIISDDHPTSVLFDEHTSSILCDEPISSILCDEHSDNHTVTILEDDNDTQQSQQQSQQSQQQSQQSQQQQGVTIVDFNEEQEKQQQPQHQKTVTILDQPQDAESSSSSSSSFNLEKKESSSSDDKEKNNSSHNEEEEEEKPLPSILNSPRTPTPKKSNNNSVVICTDSSINSDTTESSPYTLKDATINPDDLTPISSPAQAETPTKEQQDVTDDRLRSFSEEVLRRLDDITKRLSVLEERSLSQIDGD